MRILTALFHALLALAGCNGPGGSTHVTRASADGHDVVRSEVWIGERVARFECQASASGRCHYVLYRQHCAPGGRGCAPEVVDRFAVVSGGRRELLGLPADFALCVSERADAPPPECAGLN